MSYSIILIAHLLIGLFFVIFGFVNVYNWRRIMEVMTQKNIPHPWLILPIGILWETLAGFLIIFNCYTDLAALSLIPFTILSIVIFHPFWDFTGEERRLNRSLFITQMTITLGALFLLTSNLWT